MNKSEKNKKNYAISDYVIFVLLFLFGIFGILGVLYITLNISLKTPSDMQNILSLPKHPEFKNFSEAWKLTEFPLKFLNTFIITIFTASFTIITNSAVAYVIARNRQRSRFFNLLYYYFLSAMFIPFQVLMLPLVKQANFFHLDNVWGIIVLYVVFGLPMNTFLYNGVLKSIPAALDEAAYIDGANPLQIFIHVIFPILKPIHSTIAILTVMWTWNDFLMPLVLLTKQKFQTLQLSQYVFRTQFSTNYNLAFASYVMVLIPVLIVYVVCQRFIMNGVMKGSIK
ncbi:carbohydrate ABC transporter permease [Treponema sp. C6A8]|uniref:carbohydrate ABC transporter permease n=1 Tax=Treponema sp. C6A8 TaxID=1410609 RepID=UPI000486A229|nr:carbohydrate ABC transporter permease [Treponema sp. C6A8]